MKKRKWIYVQKPIMYEIYCNICGEEVEWSEFKNHVWCSKCQKDVKGTGGIFDGPIPIDAMKLFGISLDRFDLETKKIIKVVEYLKG